MKDWIPLINKLIWPFIIGVLLLVFHDGVGEIYDAILDRIKIVPHFSYCQYEK
jgi:hypothetical protein